MVPDDDRHREAVIEVATRLFAAFGYDGTSLQGVAEAAGHDPARIQQWFGDKLGLYLAVVGNAHLRERAVVENALSSLPSAVTRRDVSAAMYRLTDGYLRFCLANPQVPALWLHRWLGDAADIPDLERAYAIPLINLTRDALRAATQAGLVDDRVDLDLMVRTLIWSVYGFLHGEALARAGGGGADDPDTQFRLQNHLHQLVDRMLGLPGS
ncbi:AcrR family transcriptional regulator [Streptosporangium becharense]|uniref:AcrR family transcriptional regulator n=1 Tax=Streptosporangium becharense TaxID=1816182 RepID=A0A7W9IG45_9ACTN|nr:TetR/AcrR family transcriptional regulator [Streptosporangium becharense]MBB2908870.1 AcrR family transcriptional regulator [Streptosporangium becharense]MBB5820112.1 AcrR family transcriptional regulator [Streptosporangium becharense]